MDLKRFSEFRVANLRMDPAEIAYTPPVIYNIYNMYIYIHIICIYIWNMYIWNIPTDIWDELYGLWKIKPRILCFCARHDARCT